MVDASTACATAIQDRERIAGIPDRLMAAISLAESGRWDERRRAVVAWPWTINAEGKGQYFPTRAAAIAAARDLRARGVDSFDVGCMQINMRHHPDAFDSLEEAFDPTSNVAYAAEFLNNLRDQSGSWVEAAGRYHSATPELGVPYRTRIMQIWAKQRRMPEEELLTSDAPPSQFARLGRPSVMDNNVGTPINPRVQRLISWGRRTSGVPSVLTGRATTSLGEVRPGARTPSQEVAFAMRRARLLLEWRKRIDEKKSGTSSVVTILRGGTPTEAVASR